MESPTGSVAPQAGRADDTTMVTSAVVSFMEFTLALFPILIRTGVDVAICPIVGVEVLVNGKAVNIL